MHKGSRTLILTYCLALAAMAPTTVLARGSDIAPAPNKAPRTPVHQQTLSGAKTVAAPVPRFVEGPAVILDNERLRIGDVDMRLFGIVPPQLSASYGPQARAVLDAMIAAGSVSCTIRDRERDGRFLASCHSANSGDFSLDLLRRGLAVSARGSLRGSDLMAPYLAAEQAAQNQKLGLWTVKVPNAASDSSLREAAQAEVEKSAAKEAAKEAIKEQPKESPKPVVEPPKAETSPVALPASSLKPDAGTKLTDEAKQIPILADALQAEIANALPTDTVDAAAEDTSFVSKYQFLLGCILLVLGGLGMTLARFWFAARTRHHDRRELAHALTGELMAARATCQNRLAQMATPQGEEKAGHGWPRLRSIVFQAYAGRLGLLGAALSRQVGSIYGQANDYATYFNAPVTGDASRGDANAKRQALETLVSYIDAVLPRLAGKETPTKKTRRPRRLMIGTRLAAAATVRMLARVAQATGKGIHAAGALLQEARRIPEPHKTPARPSQMAQQPVIEDSAPTGPATDETQTAAAATPDVAPTRPAEEPQQPEIKAEALDLDATSTPDTAPAAPSAQQAPMVSEAPAAPVAEAPVADTTQAAPVAAPPPAPEPVAEPESTPAPEQQAAAKPAARRPANKGTPAAQRKAETTENTSPAPRIWNKLRDFAATHSPKTVDALGLDETFYSDYGLTPEEMEALAYGEGPAAEEAARAPLESLSQRKSKRRAGRR